MGLVGKVVSAPPKKEESHRLADPAMGMAPGEAVNTLSLEVCKQELFLLYYRMGWIICKDPSPCSHSGSSAY